MNRYIFVKVWKRSFVMVVYSFFIVFFSNGLVWDNVFFLLYNFGEWLVNIVDWKRKEDEIYAVNYWGDVGGDWLLGYFLVNVWVL